MKYCSKVLSNFAIKPKLTYRCTNWCNCAISWKIHVETIWYDTALILYIITLNILLINTPTIHFYIILLFYLMLLIVCEFITLWRTVQIYKHYTLRWYLNYLHNFYYTKLFFWKSQVEFWCSCLKSPLLLR